MLTELGRAFSGHFNSNSMVRVSWLTVGFGLGTEVSATDHPPRRWVNPKHQVFSFVVPVRLSLQIWAKRQVNAQRFSRWDRSRNQCYFRTNEAFIVPQDSPVRVRLLPGRLVPRQDFQGRSELGPSGFDQQRLRASRLDPGCPFWRYLPNRKTDKVCRVSVHTAEFVFSRCTDSGPCLRLSSNIQSPSENHRSCGRWSHSACDELLPGESKSDCDWDQCRSPFHRQRPPHPVEPPHPTRLEHPHRFANSQRCLWRCQQSVSSDRVA
jgi:hypothetical protein